MDPTRNSPREERSPTVQTPDSAAAVSPVGTPRWVRRVLIIASGICAFALVGSIISPSWSEASDGGIIRVDGGGSGGGARPRSMPMVEPPDLIGTLEGREFRILIHHAEASPRYTICTADGRVLREGLEAGDVYREFPTLDLKRLHLDPPSCEKTGPLMLMYPLD